ncbi:unnamed protein product [Amoebophrya sp. A25]|nr:unnamed protein product [Amoebophrya sp. A25]|eukprot:GSA25T00016040001.1
MKRVMQPTVNLTEKERLIFRVFLDTCKHYDLKTTLRAAGGWVRDKLLGIASDDIDIAVDQGTGEEFADHVEKYSKFIQTLDANAAPSYASKLKISSVGTVRKNPEQSKHLATACFRICGVSIDVTNLRTEVYAEESGRIPVVQVGTADEDAHRRDLTINSLFYNLQEASVEDLTGKGIQDLQYGFIRTPLDPEVTFLDDPLRVLRVVRFACRYQFDMDPEILRACRLPHVQQALACRKVSAERLGIEIEKVMKHARSPARAIHYFATTGMLEPVFLAKQIVQVGQSNARASASSTGKSDSPPNSADHINGKKQLEDAVLAAFSVPPATGNKVVPANFAALCESKRSLFPYSWQQLGYKTVQKLEQIIKRRCTNFSSAAGAGPAVALSPIAGAAAGGAGAAVSETGASRTSGSTDVISPASATKSGLGNGHQIQSSRTVPNNYSTPPSGDLLASIRFAALLVAFGNVKAPEGKKEVDAIYAILWKNLVTKKATSELAAALARTALTVFFPEIRKLEGGLGQEDDSPSAAGPAPSATATLSLDAETAVKLGTALRERKENWRWALFLAEALHCALNEIDGTTAAREVASGTKADEATLANLVLDEDSLFAAPEPDRLIPSTATNSAIASATDRLIESVESHGLENCWTWTPTFQGDTLQKRFGVKRGPMLAQYIRKQLEWRMEDSKISEDVMAEKLQTEIAQQPTEEEDRSRNQSAGALNKGKKSMKTEKKAGAGGSSGNFRDVELEKKPDRACCG